MRVPLDMVRFNEAIDQAVTESVAFHSTEMLRWRNALLAVIGHDLRGPLQSVSMGAEMLVQRLKDTPHASLAQSVIYGTYRAADLLSSLLDYSTTKVGGVMSLTKRSRDLAFSLQAEMDLLRQANPDADFRLDMQSGLTGK